MRNILLSLLSKELVNLIWLYVPWKLLGAQGKKSKSKMSSIHNTTEREIDEWKKWYGKVLGGEREIKKVLRKLKRRPKDRDELQKLIAENRMEEMKQTDHESRNSFY